MSRKKKKLEIDVNRQRPKKRKKLFLVFIPLLLIATLVYLVYVHNLNHYKYIFEDILRKKLNSDVSINSIHLHFFKRSAIRFSDITIRDTRTGQPIFEADQVWCFFDLTRLLSQKQLHCSAIKIINPAITMNSSQTELIDPANASTIQPVTKERTSTFLSKYLSRFTWLDFKGSTLSIDKIIAVNATVLKTNKYNDDLRLHAINFVSRTAPDEHKISFWFEAKPDNSQTAKIRFEGDIIFTDADSESTLKQIALSSQIDAQLSLNDISSDMMKSIFDPVSSKLVPANIIFNASANVQGSVQKNIRLKGRLNPTFITSGEQFDIDADICWDIKKKHIVFDNILSVIDNTDLSADGYFDIGNNYGEAYIQTGLMSIIGLKRLLPFLKSLDIEGKAALSAIARVSGDLTEPSFKGTFYVEQFTGNFHNLANPITLSRPCSATFSKYELLFPEAMIQYNRHPLKLKLRYALLPEKKLFLTIDDLSQIQLLEIFSATAESVAPVASSAKNIKKQDTSPPSRPPRPHTNRGKRSRKRIPIYINASVTDAYLYRAHFDRLYIDTLFEGDRMLFKEISIFMYEGEFRGNGVITFGTTPSFAFVADADNININDLLTANSAFKNIFYGRLSAATSFQCQGLTAPAIIDNLTSRGTLKIDNGKIENFELLRDILNQFSDESADSKLKLFGSTIGLRMPPIEEFDIGQHTVFQSLRCDYSIKKNKYGKTAFHTNSLKMKSLGTNITMWGNFDFDKNLDFKGDLDLSVIQTEKLLHKVKELGILFDIKNKRMLIPFKLKGTWDNPKPTPIIKLNQAQQSLEHLFQEKLFPKKSDETAPSSREKEIFDIKEKDLKKLKKIKKKLKKYLED